MVYWMEDNMNDDKLLRANQLKKIIKEVTQCLENWEKITSTHLNYMGPWDMVTLPCGGITPPLLKQFKEQAILNLTIDLRNAKEEYEKL